jgi:hypothetical protein|tara:strand:- start:778 stop:1212 length:435 start_codon:yes stop_codon:yes gene_type:complete
MPNPAVPVEKKRMLGNPGKRALPGEDAIVLHSGRVEPPEDLGKAGVALWSRVFDEGEIWISPRLDTTLLERVCRALDRIVVLESEFESDPTNRQVVMSINETDKLIMSGLGLLGFTPSDRARLGLAEVKRQSKLEEMMSRAEGL